MEHTERNHGHIYLHNLKEGNLQCRSPLEAVPNSMSRVPALIDTWWRTPREPSVNTAAVSAPSSGFELQHNFPSQW